MPGAGCGFFFESIKSAKLPLIGTVFLFFLSAIGLLLVLSKSKVLPCFSIKIGQVSQPQLRALT